jgi:hypothetical protein
VFIVHAPICERDACFPASVSHRRIVNMFV